MEGNFEKRSDKSMSDLENEQSLILSELEKTACDAISGGSSSMMTAIFQNSAVHAEVDAYLDFLKINTGELQRVDFPEVDDPVCEELDDKIQELEHQLQHASGAIQQYVGGSISSRWQDIDGIRREGDAYKQQHIQSLVEKDEVLALVQKQDQEAAADRSKMKNIIDGLRQQLLEKDAAHANAKSVSESMIREMDTLKARLARKKIVPRQASIELLYPSKGK